MNVRIVNKSTHPLPSYETVHSAGMDIRANLTQNIVLKPLQRSLIPTGIFVELPIGFEAQIRPRSGNAFKYGITVLNSPGTIDADYRGEIKVILINLSDTDFEVENGMRIAQMIVSKHERVDWNEVEILNETERGTGGYGHTGIK
jgi:dUTP pyrophosphatase